MMGANQEPLPGNKRQPRSRAATLRWKNNPDLELRLVGVEGPGTEPRETVASAKERAVVLSRLPVLSLVGALQRDEPFLAGLEAIVDDDVSAEELASRYQRRGSYGFRVIQSIIETAVQPTIERLVESQHEIRRALRAGMVTHNLPPLAFFPDAELDPRDRKRWRPPRDEGIETLLRRGAGKCLACGVPLARDGRRFYCSGHAASEPGARRGDQDRVVRSHDNAIANAAAVVEEAGRCLEVQ